MLSARTRLNETPRCQRPNPWQGKKLLVDLDGTLIDSVERTGKSSSYEVKTVNDAALRTLPALRRANAMCLITSGGDRAYVTEMVEATGINNIADGIFTMEDLIAPKGKGMRDTPKNYRKVIELVGERNPLANCAVIGNDPGIDVPINPEGMVTAIINIDTQFGLVIAYLRVFLELGKGSFAEGFDLMCQYGRRMGSTKLLKRNDWRFDGGFSGSARVLYFRPSTEA